MSSRKRPDHRPDYGYHDHDCKDDHKHDHCHDHHHGHHHHDHCHDDHCYDDKCSLLPIEEGCCTATTGCEWDGTLRNIVTEPIFTQKVYDAALSNLQALSTLNNVKFYPELPRGCRVIKIIDVRCKKFFKPSNINDPRNFKIKPKVELSGGEFIKDEKGKYVEVVGPDGLPSQKLIYADTEECDCEGKGTPVFGTQKIKITGNVTIEIELLIAGPRDRKRKFTIKANVPITSRNSPLVLTNFFELCIPSVENSAFFPRYTEFCNVSCETRLATNRAARDLKICPDTRSITVDLIIALCASCEQKILVPSQLCVLSSGFPKLSPETSPICSTFPALFPKQIDENSQTNPDHGCHDKPFKFSMDNEHNMSVMEFEDEDY